ncbi:MAG: 50S ribosomal protein L2 [Mycoplasmataceae bacterium RV_VA103A]|nr:MAG: 50S ribosomal protein L2 [Mycoplasmataceae bacterium RV_VA103A]
MKSIRPLTNSRRNTILLNYREKLSPYKKGIPRKLLKLIQPHSGRNNQGKITVRHQGGRHKRFYRVIDWKRYEKDNIEGKIVSIEYDPGRNCFIHLVSHRDGSFTLVIAPEGLKIDDKIISGNNENVPIKTGNNLPLRYIPLNTPIHNLELKKGKGGQIARGAGTYAEIIGKEENSKYVLVKLPSKEVRKVLADCRATIGKVGNSEANLVRLGKAGRSRWRGIRSTTRGSAMNPCDHPHGGKEKQPIGHDAPRSPWGWRTLGRKTRKKRKPSTKFIVRRRQK